MDPSISKGGSGRVSNRETAHLTVLDASFEHTHGDYFKAQCPAKPGHGRDSSGPRALVSYPSIQHFTQRVELYRGSVSTVYKALDETRGVPVVLKCYHKKSMQEKHFHKLEREIRAMVAMHGPYVADLHGYYIDGAHIFLVMEYCEGGDLFKYLLLKGGRLDEAFVCLEIVAPMLRVLEKLHALKLMHRDIKPENIFLTRHHKLKLGDFGLAINCTEEIPFSRSGTLDYMAPEVLKNPASQMQESPLVDLATLAAKSIRPYTHKVDIWAVGVLAYELVVGKPPFEVEDESQTASLIMYSNNIRFPVQHSPLWADFVKLALTKDAGSRPDAATLMQHQWIQSNLQKALLAAAGRRSSKETLLQPLPLPGRPSSMNIPAPEVMTPPRCSTPPAPTHQHHHSHHHHYHPSLTPPRTPTAAAAVAALHWDSHAMERSKSGLPSVAFDSLGSTAVAAMTSAAAHAPPAPARPTSGMPARPANGGSTIQQCPSPAQLPMAVGQRQVTGRISPLSKMSLGPAKGQEQELQGQARNPYAPQQHQFQERMQAQMQLAAAAAAAAAGLTMSAPGTAPPSTDALLMEALQRAAALSDPGSESYAPPTTLEQLLAAAGAHGTITITRTKPPQPKHLTTPPVAVTSTPPYMGPANSIPTHHTASRTSSSAGVPPTLTSSNNSSEAGTSSGGSSSTNGFSAAAPRPRSAFAIPQLREHLASLKETLSPGRSDKNEAGLDSPVAGPGIISRVKFHLQRQAIL